MTQLLFYILFFFNIYIICSGRVLVLKLLHVPRKPMRAASLFSMKTTSLRLSFITANAGDVFALLAESCMLFSFMNTAKRLILLQDNQNGIFVTATLFVLRFTGI